jgi:glycosyltransferase involved in cell wall biosynthesis
VILTGPHWQRTAPAGPQTSGLTAKQSGGTADLITVPGYAGAGQRCALIDDSDVAVFPYRFHPSFQGSGAIADYLAHGAPVLATEVANMAELVGDAGLIVPANDPDAFADALNRFGSARQRETLTRAAWRRAHMFTAIAHAQQCLTFYERVLRRYRPRWR